MTGFFRHTNVNEVEANARAALKNEPGFLDIFVAYPKIAGLPTICVYYKHTCLTEELENLKNKIGAIDTQYLKFDFIPMGPVRSDTA